MSKQKIKQEWIVVKIVSILREEEEGIREKQSEELAYLSNIL